MATKPVIGARIVIAGRSYDLSLPSDEIGIDGGVLADNNPAGLNQALADLPAQFGWWAALEALARTEAEEAENRREKVWGELYAHYEAALAVGDGDQRRRPVVEAVRGRVVRDQKYETAWRAAVKAKEALNLVAAGRKSVERRQKSLEAIASNMRKELDAYGHDRLRQIRDRVRLARRGGGG